MILDLLQNRKNFSRIAVPITLLLILASVFIPFYSSAQGLVPCNGPDCDYGKLIELAKNIINYLILFTIPLAAIAFAWAGFTFITAAGNESKISKAKEIFWKVSWGFIIVLTAWMIVYLITQALLSDTYVNDANFPIR